VLVGLRRGGRRGRGSWVACRFVVEYSMYDGLNTWSLLNGPDHLVDALGSQESVL
jgi:hypothetical protein